VAFHLAKVFLEQQNEVSIFRRSDRNDTYFSQLIGIHRVNEIADFSNDIEYCILAVNDEKIKEVAEEIIGTNAFVLHTSGSISIDALSGLNFNNYGVFYPLQSFSINRKLSYRNIPVLLESYNENEYDKLDKLAHSFSDISQVCTSEKRKKLHLAAVIVNNFVNHLYVEVAELLESDKMNELLIPLIRETASRLENENAKSLQTGPAKRGDITIIEDHISMLSEFPELQKLYKIMSDSIRSKHNS